MVSRKLKLLLVVACVPAAAYDCSTATAFQGGHNQGTIVKYNGSAWVSNFWSMKPPAPGLPEWTLLAPCDGPSSNPCLPPWTPQVYSNPTVVSFQGHNWKNQWYASPAEMPGASPWQDLGICEGDASAGPQPTLPVVSETVRHPPATQAPVVSLPSEAQPPQQTDPPPPSAEIPHPDYPQVCPNGPTVPDGRCIWPAWAAEASYPGNSFVTQDGKVYKNTYWADAGAKPPAAPWTEVATCTGAPPVPSLTEEQMRDMLGPNPAGVQAVLDPWNPTLPCMPEIQEIENQIAATSGPLYMMVKEVTRKLALSEVEKISPGKMHNPENVKRVERLFPAEEFDRVFPARHVSYTYENFLKGIGLFPAYCGTYTDGRDSDLICKKLLATSFAHHVQEVGANWPTMTYNDAAKDPDHHNKGSDAFWKASDPLPMWNQALWYVRESGTSENVDDDRYKKCLFEGEDTLWAANYPCGGKAGKRGTYTGRGAKQISWNYNYGLFSRELYGDVNYLLENPHLCADSWLNFASGIWFAVTPQSPKPPMIWAIDGTWKPNAADLASGNVPGFGVTINIINGGVECRTNSNTAVDKRVYAYKEFAKYFGFTIDPNEKLDCYGMKEFTSQGSAALNIYWSRTWSGKPACQAQKLQTPWTILHPGDYAKCIDYFFRSHWFKDGKHVSDYGLAVGQHW